MVDPRFPVSNSQIKLETILSNLVDLAYHSFDCETFCLFLLAPEGDLNLFQFRTSRASLKKEARIEIGEGIVGWTAKEGKELLVENFDRPSRTLGYYTGSEVVHSILSSPILLEGKAEGVLIVDRKEGSFDPLDRERIKGVSRQAAILISLFRSSEESQRSSHRFTLFHEMTREISGRLHRDEVYDWIMETIDKIFTYDEMTLVLTKGKEGVIERRKGVLSGLREGMTFPLDENSMEIAKQSFSGIILKNKVTLLKEDLWKDGRKVHVFYPGEPPLYRSLVGTPLFSSKEPIGMIALLKREKNGYHEMDSHLLSLVGQMASQSLERSLLYEKTEALAIRDGLTGLYNHRTFQETITSWIKSQKTFSLLLIDVDHFKVLNDRYGHPAGDEVLKRVSQILLERTGDRDFVGRYGGEEFSILTPMKGMDLAERVRQDIQNSEFKIQNSLLKVTVSIGAAQFPRDAEEKRKLIELVDQNLYRAKESGRNRVFSSRGANE